jgi:hypothetical protein
MKTRLITIALILTLSAPLALAQSGEKGRSSFAILGGINFQNLNGELSTGDKLESDMLLGYHVGVNVQLPIVPQFSTRFDVCSKRS